MQQNGVSRSSLCSQYIIVHFVKTTDVRTNEPSNTHSALSSPLTCEVPQGSVLGPVLFNVYTTPRSSLISASSISHVLYADNTQLFISFVPKNFSSAINNLQSTITLISSWISFNYLTLNPYKTEIVNPSLSLPTTKPIMPSQSAKNLCFIFDSTLIFLQTDFIPLQRLSLPYSRYSPHPIYS